MTTLAARNSRLPSRRNATIGSAWRNSTNTMTTSSSGPGGDAGQHGGRSPAQVGPLGDAVHEQAEAAAGQQEAEQVEPPRPASAAWRRNTAPNTSAAAPMGTLT